MGRIVVTEGPLSCGVDCPAWPPKGSEVLCLRPLKAANLDPKYLEGGPLRISNLDPTFTGRVPFLVELFDLAKLL